VDVAVVEAGLGGRYDATNVIPSKVQVLTTVGLEHTRWLGPTIEDIAREKLDVVRDHATLVTGPLVPEAAAIAREVAGARHARHVEVTEPWRGPLGPRGDFQRWNFAVAVAAAEAFLAELIPSTPDSRASIGSVERAAVEVRVPGRLEQISDSPRTLVDSAHNPDGARALAATLEGERFTGVVAILDDKDAAAMLRELLPLFDQVVFTRSANPRSLPPATLESLSTQLKGPPATIEPDAKKALERARALGGPVLATGSIYLIADLVATRGRARASTL
jgi:dihydrofolate synthase/folylpolyglutamate synthase